MNVGRWNVQVQLAHKFLALGQQGPFTASELKLASHSRWITTLNLRLYA